MSEEVYQYIEQERDLKRWYTEIPNLYDDADLDPYEFRLLVHYVRVGKCWESTKTTASKCKMSMGKVSETRKGLQEKNFIAIHEEADKKTLVITLVDKWDENFEKYKHRSPGERKNVNNIKELINFFVSQGERIHRPLSAFVELFGKFKNEDQAAAVYRIYTTYGESVYFEALEWLNEKTDHKNINSTIKAFETAAANWGSFEDDNKPQSQGPGGMLV